MINIFKALMEKMENFNRKMEIIRNSKWKCQREKPLNELTNRLSVDEERVSEVNII